MVEYSFTFAKTLNTLELILNIIIYQTCLKYTDKNIFNVLAEYSTSTSNIKELISNMFKVWKTDNRV